MHSATLNSNTVLAAAIGASDTDQDATASPVVSGEIVGAEVATQAQPNAPPRKRLKNVLRVLIATLKGGVAKTTTTVMLAFALARKGYKVVAICADTRSQGLSDWRDMMIESGQDFPITIITWRGEELDGKLSRFAKRMEIEHDADAVLIDTGGEHIDVFMSAALYADRLLSPIKPTKAEFRRLPATEDAAAEVTENGSPILMSVVFCRVHRPRLGRSREVREVVDGTIAEMTEGGAGYEMHVMDTEIPQNDTAYADVWGEYPEDLGAYDRLADEILDQQEEAAA